MIDFILSIKTPGGEKERQKRGLKPSLSLCVGYHTDIFDRHRQRDPQSSYKLHPSKGVCVCDP